MMKRLILTLSLTLSVFSLTLQAQALNLALLDDNEYSASSTYPGGYVDPSTGKVVDYGVLGAFDGDRKGLNWRYGGGWNDGTRDSWPDWIQVKFKTPKVVKKIVLTSLQYGFYDPVEPYIGMGYCSTHGFWDFEIQFSMDGQTWTTVAKRQHDYECLHIVELEKEIRTLYVRTMIFSGNDHYSRMVEKELYGVR